MKKKFVVSVSSFALCFIVATSCGSSSTLPNATSTNNQTAIQSDIKSDWTTQPNKSALNPGAINLSASNFYFSGNLTIASGEPQLLVCLTDAPLSIDTQQGIYEELQKEYSKLTAGKTESVQVQAQLRGYLQNGKLTVSYINSLTKGNACTNKAVLCGNWVAKMPGNHNINATMKINSDFTFSAILSGEVNQVITGQWLMTSNAEIALLYTVQSDAFGHHLSFNPQSMKIFIPTNDGTYLFTKQ